MYKNKTGAKRVTITCLIGIKVPNTCWTSRKRRKIYCMISAIFSLECFCTIYMLRIPRNVGSLSFIDFVKCLIATKIHVQFVKV